MMRATCPECGRVFDLLDEHDADEYHSGHDCEPVAVEVVEVDSERGEVHAEAWAWPDGQPVGAGAYAYTQEGPGALPQAIARALDGGAVRVVVRPLMGNRHDLDGREVTP